MEAETAYRRAAERGSPDAEDNLSTTLRRSGDHAGADAILARLDEVNGHVSGDEVLAEAIGSGVPTSRVDSADELSIALATHEQERGRTGHVETILREVIAAGRPARGLAALNLGILLDARIAGGDQPGRRSGLEGRRRRGAAVLPAGGRVRDGTFGHDSPVTLVRGQRP